MAHRVVMVTSSYPRFPGDHVGSFVEPIAKGLAARGHEVHLVAPWHPLLRRGTEEEGVRFHFFRYAPIARLAVFGYAAALKADVSLRASAVAAAPFALVRGWQAARRVAAAVDATLMHAHWAIPGGAIAAAAAGRRPLVISLHGSDIYVAERHAVARAAARAAFSRAARITACSDDLRRRAVALGAPADRVEVVPYGVDANRFQPDPDARARRRTALGLGTDDPLLFAAGRLVRKKGFEYLIDAARPLVAAWPRLLIAIAGSGDLEEELRARAARAGVERHVRFLGVVSHEEMPELLSAADLAVVPSVRDASGNVDGLPNTVMEALASGTPLVATDAGGIGAAVQPDRTAALVPERDAGALAAALDRLLRSPQERRALGAAAREHAIRSCSWERTAERFELIYTAAAGD